MPVQRNGRGGRVGGGERGCNRREAELPPASSPAHARAAALAAPGAGASRRPVHALGLSRRRRRRRRRLVRAACNTPARTTQHIGGASQHHPYTHTHTRLLQYTDQPHTVSHRQGGYIFYAGGSIAGVSCRRRWPRLLLLS